MSVTPTIQVQFLDAAGIPIKSLDVDIWLHETNGRPAGIPQLTNKCGIVDFQLDVGYSAVADIFVQGKMISRGMLLSPGAMNVIYYNDVSSLGGLTYGGSVVTGRRSPREGQGRSENRVFFYLLFILSIVIYIYHSKRGL